MADVNPFDVLKMGNDPSLTQRTVQGSKALADLQRGTLLQSMSDKAAFRKQQLVNEGTRNNALIGQRINPGLVDAMQLLEEGRQAEINSTRASTLRDSAGFGLGTKRFPGLDLTQALSPNLPAVAVKRTGDTETSIRNITGTKDAMETKVFEYFPSSPGAIGTSQKRVTTKRSERSTKTQGTPAAREAANKANPIEIPAQDFDAFLEAGLIVEGTQRSTGRSGFILRNPKTRQNRFVTRGR